MKQTKSIPCFEHGVFQIFIYFLFWVSRCLWFPFPWEKKNKKKWGGGGWGWGKIMWSLESRKTKLVLCLGVKLKQTAWILMNMKSFKFSYVFYFEWHVVCGFLFPGKNNINKSNLGERGGSGCLLITSSKPCKSENFALDKT